MRHDQNIELFMAAFYADLNVLQKLIGNEFDMQVRIPILSKELEDYWGNEYVEINVLDILNWAANGFYEYFDEDNLCVIHSYDDQDVRTCINPSEYYSKVLACIVWLCDNFKINNFTIKDYSRYRLLRHVICDDENWLDADEIKEALEKGYREIENLGSQFITISVNLSINFIFSLLPTVEKRNNGNLYFAKMLSFSLSLSACSVPDL